MVIKAIKNGELANYWMQSETYELLKIYIEMDEDGLKEAIVQMLGGAKVRIDAATFQNDMTMIRSKDEVLTLLVHLGYLVYDAEDKIVNIPNEEIREEFLRAVTAPAFYNNEQALRSVVHMAYISCVDEYLKIDELPSGHGYADIVFFPGKGSSRPLLLIELKWNRTDAGAIHQMKQKDYPQALKDYGGDMLLVGINYDAKSKKHTCKIEMFRE